MGKITDHIKRVLETNELVFEIRPDNDKQLTTFAFGIKGDHIHMRVNIVVDEETERYMIRCYPDWYVPKDKRAEILSLLNALNVSRWLTRVGMDPDDGELTYVYTVLCKGARLSEKNTEAYIYTAIGVADDETEEVIRTVYGGGGSQSTPGNINENGAPSLPWTPRSDN